MGVIAVKERALRIYQAWFDCLDVESIIPKQKVCSDDDFGH